MRIPTEKQYRLLSVLGGVGTWVVAPRRGEWGPLLRRGWVQPIREDDQDKRFLPPLQITPEGLRALADAAERYGLPEWERSEGQPEQLNEAPAVTRLKAQLDEVKAERDEARRAQFLAERQLRHIRTALDGWSW